MRKGIKKWLPGMRKRSRKGKVEGEKKRKEECGNQIFFSPN